MVLENYGHYWTLITTLPFGCWKDFCCAIWLCRTSITKMCAQVFNPIKPDSLILLNSMPSSRQPEKISWCCIWMGFKPLYLPRPRTGHRRLREDMKAAHPTDPGPAYVE